MNRICVCGLGYIGLPTAAMFATNGVYVSGVEINQHAIDTINQGKIHIVEPGLADIVKAVVQSGHLKAFSNASEADAYIICVPTPFGEGFEPDLSYVEAAITEIASYIRKGNTVILESTSPVGTTEKVAEMLNKLRPDLVVSSEDSEECDIYVSYCPERVLPGKIMSELINNDRIIGGINKISAEKAADIYAIFVKGDILKTNARTAEMSKLAENAFRDVNIAFANELSLICDKLNINVWELISLANHHPRVNILNPGPGVGGHCIAVDPWFIVNKTPEQAKLIRTAREVNDSKPNFVVEQVRKISNKHFFGKCSISCLGLAFKPNVDDLRESPAISITRNLASEFLGSVVAVEPNITSIPKELGDLGVALVSLEEALCSDILVLLVDHKEFKCFIPKLSSNQFLVDTRGCWDLFNKV